jgi:hypothetical protein
LAKSALSVFFIHHNIFDESFVYPQSMKTGSPTALLIASRSFAAVPLPLSLNVTMAIVARGLPQTFIDGWV